MLTWFPESDILRVNLKSRLMFDRAMKLLRVPVSRKVLGIVSCFKWFSSLEAKLQTLLVKFIGQSIVNSEVEMKKSFHFQFQHSLLLLGHLGRDILCLDFVDHLFDNRHLESSHLFLTWKTATRNWEICCSMLRWEVGRNFEGYEATPEEGKEEEKEAWLGE